MEGISLLQCQFSFFDYLSRIIIEVIFKKRSIENLRLNFLNNITLIFFFYYFCVILFLRLALSDIEMNLPSVTKIFIDYDYLEKFLMKMKIIMDYA